MACGTPRARWTTSASIRIRCTRSVTRSDGAPVARAVFDEPEGVPGQCQDQQGGWPPVVRLTPHHEAHDALDEPHTTSSRYACALLRTQILYASASSHNDPFPSFLRIAASHLFPECGRRGRHLPSHRPDPRARATFLSCSSDREYERMHRSVSVFWCRRLTAGAGAQQTHPAEVDGQRAARDDPDATAGWWRCRRPVKCGGGWWMRVRVGAR
ncbi:hypothetical protein B0H12DRAFT_410026 [Mycena haematopus]|nr:hypothetical protein B0H12DRAFT_410026 [Mycena haematopus]